MVQRPDPLESMPPAFGTNRNAADARTLVDSAVADHGFCPRAIRFLRSVPEPGSILRLRILANADRILMVGKTLDPDNRIRTGRPLR